ncbi:TPA: PAAR domain-containing protein [Burkholderia aenigmatica]|uniref:PAAR domain-containing protein n=1 Tax=Burkholderia TaxID=32008 RepID=UPI0015822003|nr:MULTISPECIES: PAAR domain-containing protein [Burkholderia]HDR9484122.1 PAAR domain-containing protein [Burkholderia aenigmatica]HDR9515087.1 PAAR domain-containing protein [Burkholderia aenigmatica]HDR9592172.1 PAAR domain-containing protein [Burkholderia aenigmatica]HDR9603546.1 PAAR domain-containing protein [Burkholderia aenigmatica]HDR9610905.1 PAAR domain-containing protein [Burkholderia aenigmatica]
MTKAAIRDSDPTTTRGFVIAISSTIYDDERRVALSGDKATCGNCDGTFDIIGSGEGLSENGRNVVVDGDWVGCPCRENRVIVGNNPGIFLESSGSTHPAESSAQHLRSTTPTPAIHDEQIRLIDRSSGWPLTDLRYRITDSSGRLVEGRTDGNGRTRRFETSCRDAIDIQIYRGK